MIRQKISQWLQYLYFLRFSLLAWVFLPLLVYLDGFGKTTALTRGILTVNSSAQAFYAAFFVVALHMTVLVTTRNTIINGEDRFASPPPPLLKLAICSIETKSVWLTLLVAHLPTLIVIAYLGYIAHREQETFYLLFFGKAFWYVFLYLAAGILVGILFWYLVSLFYYWTYNSSANQRAPAALIFPETIFGDTCEAPHPELASWIDRVSRPILQLTHQGYAPNADGPFWELHFLSTVSLIGFFLLYLFLYPATAPTVRRASLYFCNTVAFLITLAFLHGIRSVPFGASRWAPRVKLFFQVLAILLLSIFLWGTFVSVHTGFSSLEMAFPTLASILVIATFFLWLFAGAAFFFDRYRLPVLTLVVVALFLPKSMHWGKGEHFYSARPLNHQVISPTPDQALASRMSGSGEPYIILTASGGGIHAAAWTAEVVARLEEAFASDPSLNPADRSTSYAFHDHVLLASGVSGGSDGLMPFLLEYLAPRELAFTGLQDNSLHARLTGPPACSGLEAVAWGLEYYDLYRFLVNFTPPDSWTSEDAPDRSWALAAAFNRNLHDPHCQTRQLSLQPDGEVFTLAKASDLLRQGKIPAFTFNTTAAETGDRFLLSDYQVPPLPSPRTDFLTAESFLQAYAQENPCLHPLAYADLPLATAARLSATFPYVSSGTRIPLRYTEHAYHFLDGGYFDNDGTSSVVEFLKAAIDPRLKTSPASPSNPHCGGDPARAVPDSSVGSAPPSQESQAKPDRPLKILLIEIRDGADLNPQSDDDLARQNEKATSDWTALTQLIAPPVALWKAGHESISRRNRRELCLLETSYRDRIHIHHLVFSITTPTSRTQPLSWHLTSHQHNDILESAAAYEPSVEKNAPRVKTSTQNTIDEAIRWIKTELPANSKAAAEAPDQADAADVCAIAEVPHPDPAK